MEGEVGSPHVRLAVVCFLHYVCGGKQLKGDVGGAVEAVHGLLRLMARGGGDVVKNVPGHGSMRNA